VILAHDRTIPADLRWSAQLIVRVDRLPSAGPLDRQHLKAPWRGALAGDRFAGVSLGRLSRASESGPEILIAIPFSGYVRRSGTGGTME